MTVNMSPSVSFMMISEIVRDQPLHPGEPPVAARLLVPDAAALGERRPVQDEPNARRERRAAHELRHPPDAYGEPAPDGEPEDPLPQLGEPVQKRPAARENHAGPQLLLEPGPEDLLAKEREDLLRPRLDDLAQVLAPDRPRLAPADARQLHELVPAHLLDRRAPRRDLERLRVRRRDPQSHRHVGGDVGAAQGEDEG